MKVHFLLVGAVSIGLLTSSPDSDAHGGGGGHGGAMFHGGRFAGFFGRGRFFGPGFGFYGYGYPWWDWDYPYYPGPYYGDDAYYGGPSDGDQEPSIFVHEGSPSGTRVARLLQPPD